MTRPELEALAKSAVELGVQHAMASTGWGQTAQELVTRAATTAVDALVEALHVHVVGDVLVVRDERAAAALSQK